MNRLRKAGLALLLTGILAPGAVAQSPGALPDEASQRRDRELQMRFVCQCGCNYILRHCRHNMSCSAAPVMRREIRAGMNAGLDDKAIVASMVASFGTVALSEPPYEGFNILGWWMPSLALLFGLALVFSIAIAWRRRAPAAAAPVDPALLEKYRDAVEREFKELE